MKRIEKEKKEEEIAYYAELAKQEENEIEYYLILFDQKGKIQNKKNLFDLYEISLYK